MIVTGLILVKRDSALRAWLTWETQRLNEEFARAFDCEFYKFDYSYKPRMLRYLCSAWHTLKVIYNKKYDIVFAQYPSVVLVFLLTLLRIFGKNFGFVVYAHNAAIQDIEHRRLIGLIAKFCLKHADFAIVSNTALIDKYGSYGIKVKVLPDMLPRFESSNLPECFANHKRPFVTLISTFAPDEPTEILLQAVKQAQESHNDFQLFITGRRSKAGSLLKYENERVRFTDYLSLDDYDGLLMNSDLLIDLTTRENCLVCGAYEALSAGIPAILSDTEALRSNFRSGFVFSRNTCDDYKYAIHYALENLDSLSKDIKAFSEEFQSNWNLCKNQVDRKLIDLLESS